MATRRRQGDLEIISASTIVKAHNTDGLGNWKVDRAIEVMRSHPNPASADPATVKAAMYDPPAGQAFSSAQTGTILHATFEHWLQGDPAPATVEDGDRGVLPGIDDPRLAYAWPMAAQLSAFMSQHPIRPVVQERFVFHPDHRIGGRLDLVADIDGERWIIDLKTSLDDTTKWGREKTPFATSVALQLATYRHATHMYGPNHDPRVMTGRGRRLYLVGPDDIERADPMVGTERAGVIFLTPERCDLWEIDAGVETFHHACVAAESWRWQFGDEADGVMGATPVHRVRA